MRIEAVTWIALLTGSPHNDSRTGLSFGVFQPYCKHARASSPAREPRFVAARRSTSNEPSRSNHRAPRGRDEPIAAAGLLDVAEAGEREVIARDQELVGRSHVVDSPARRHGLLRLVVEHHLPIGVAQE